MRDVLPQHSYPLTPLSQRYWMDTQRCYHDKRKNPDQLFEIFASLNDEDPVNVRSDMISRIKHECNYYEIVGKDHLKRVGLNINQLLSLMESPSVYGDELMLFALARTYQRHVVVFTHNHCWSNNGTDDFITGERLLESCDLKLLYIGQHMFTELKQKLFIPITKPVINKAPSYAHLKMMDNSTPHTAIDLRTQTNNANDPQSQFSALEDSAGVNIHAHDIPVPALNTNDTNSDYVAETIDSGLSDIKQYLDYEKEDTSSGGYCQSSNNPILRSDTMSDGESSLDVDLGLNTPKSANKNALAVKTELKNKDVIGLNNVTSSSTARNDTDDCVISSNVTQPPLHYQKFI